MIRLTIKTALSQTSTFEIKDEPVIYIGRSSDCQLKIEDEKASRQHARIERMGTDYRVVDLVSRNGTLVNGQTIREHVLRPGDVIQIGGTTIAFGEKPAQPNAPAKPAFKTPANLRTPGGRLRTPLKLEISTGDSSAGDIPPVAGEPAPAAPYVHPAMAGLGAAPRGGDWKSKAIFAGIAAAVLLVGTVLWNNYSKEKAYQEAASALMTEGTMAQDRSDWKTAYDRFKTIDEKYGQAKVAGAARTALDRVRTQMGVETRARTEYAALESRRTALRANENPMSLKADYEAFVKTHDGTEAARQAQLILEGLGQAFADYADAQFAEEDKHVAALIARGDFGGANDALNNFVTVFEGTPAAQRAVDRKTGLEKTAKADYEHVVARGRELLDKADYEAAKALYRDNLDRFVGTGCDQELRQKLRNIDLLVMNAADRAKAEALELKRSAILRLTAKADELVRVKKYLQAYKEYQKILADLTRPEDAPIRPEVEARMKEVQGQAGLFQRLIDAVAKATLAVKSYELAGGIQGSVKHADETNLSITFPNGSTMVPWVNVPAAQMVDLFERLSPLSPDERYQVGVFCYDNRLPGEGASRFFRLLKDEPARQATVFGFVARFRNMEVPSDGFVYFEGQWFTHVEERYAKLDSAVAKVCNKLQENNEEYVDKAFADLGSLLSQPDLTEQFRTTTKDRANKALTARRAKMIETLKKLPALIGLEALKKMKEELNTRRRQALDLIMDDRRWPYPHKEMPMTKEEQQDFVAWIKDEKRGIDPAFQVKLLEHIEKGGGTYDARITKMVDMMVQRVRDLWEPKEGDNLVARLDKRVEEMCAALKRHDEKYMTPLGLEIPQDEALTTLVRNLNSAVDIKNVCVNGTEEGIRDYNKRVWDYNANYKSSFITALEYKQIEITNKYREMMGRKCVGVNEKVVKCARGHSDWMARTGKFAHEEDDNPRRKSPSDRAALEGYGGVSENIYMGSSDPQAAHNGWYSSSGHHRNLVMPGHSEMGAGNTDRYWTQNFGSGGINWGEADKNKGSKEPHEAKGPVKTPGARDDGSAPPAGN